MSHFATRLARILRAQLAEGGRDWLRRVRDAASDGGGASTAPPFEDPTADGDPSGVGDAPSGDGRDPELARCYANLEVPYGADPETVQRAYKRLIRLYHPDRHSADPDKAQTATELIQGLNRAYATIQRHQDARAT
ncbi:MAG: DnaJ domain-containing protein [Acidobacteriota bacterium]